MPITMAAGYAVSFLDKDGAWRALPGVLSIDLAPTPGPEPVALHLQTTVSGCYTIHRWTWDPDMADVFRAYAKLLNIRRRYRKVSWRRLDRSQQWAAFWALLRGDIVPQGR